MRELIASIDGHLAQGRRLYPLKPGAKHALHEGYQTTQYSKDDLIHYISTGQTRGLGWLLGPYDLVIDVDPRKAGAQDEMKVLMSRLSPGRDLATTTPCVHTGRGDGGCHYYMRFGQIVKPLRSQIPDFPSLEFKSCGQSVVVAYSVHPLTEQPYYPDPRSPTSPLTVPLWLQGLLTQTSHIPRSAQYEPISAAELEALLVQLNPSEFCHNDEWLPILMAAHQATRGGGLETFVQWSLADPLYADQDHTIRTRWASLDPDRDDGVTLATLNKLVTDRGGYPCRPRPVLLAPRSDADVLTELLDTAKSMTSETSGATIERCLRRALDAGPLIYKSVKRQIKETLQLSAADFDEYLARLKLQIRAENNARKIEMLRRAEMSSQKSLAVALAEETYRRQYESRYLVHASNQQFYAYTGTHWEPVAPNILTQTLYQNAAWLKATYPKLEERLVQTIEPAQTALIALTATAQDVFGFADVPKSVLNCRNGELWIDPRTGQTDFRMHRYDSYLLNCLPIAYDPWAACPKLDRGLKTLFQEMTDPSDMIRHIWEIIGYIAQPRKDLPAYFVFHGRGENGKTHLSRILMALLGVANVLPRSLSDFLGNGNQHALAALPGKLLMLDDDANIKAELPASALKKLAETKELEANPKFQTPFVFRATASPLILINDWPRITDLSHGMLRKAHIIPFRHEFGKSDGVPNFADEIIATEMSGVLNRAVEGLQRLRARGKFQIPVDCQKAHAEWLALANPLIGFVQGLRKNPEGAMAFGALYNQYRNWCLITGIRHPIQQTTFEMSLLQLGFKIGGDEKMVRGIEIKA
jgi:P4 family phage/plasmid primase-like protien